MKKWWLKLLLCLCVLNTGVSFAASFMDNDTFCINYGCVVTCDNNTCNVYDQWSFASGAPIASGAQLIFYATNPISGTGTVNSVYRNTANAVITPTATQGTRVAIINQVGGPTPLAIPDTNASGFLDVGDALTKFGVGATTDVDWVATPAAGATGAGTNPQRHAFYYGSRNAQVNIRAAAVNVASAGAFGTSVTPASVGLTVGFTLTGNDGGIAYGGNAIVGANFINAGVANLSFLIPGPTTVFSFTGATGTRNGNTPGGGNDPADIVRHCVRFEVDYTVPQIDLSQGAGVFNYRVDFTFWRR